MIKTKTKIVQQNRPTRTDQQKQINRVREKDRERKRKRRQKVRGNREKQELINENLMSNFTISSFIVIIRCFKD